MSAHLRRRGRHAGRPRAPLASPAVQRVGPAAVGVALTAGMATPAAAAVPSAPSAVGPVTPVGFPTTIEGYAPFVPQDRCSPSAKPGVLAFQRLVLRTYPDTGSSGIVRDCHVGGRSEHKEGRAWDWRVSALDPHQAAEAEALLRWLLKTDADGNRAAIARRLGIMYIVWNRQIWGSYRAEDGWRRYRGAEAHTDHVHFSFSWKGANKKTSFWKATGWGHISRATYQRYGQSVLRAGASGAAVVPLQRALGVRPADGIFGPRTKAAVVKFQQHRRIRADGVVGPQTWRALVVPTPPRPSPTTRARPPAHVKPEVRPSSTTVRRYDDTVLRPGVTGPAVRVVQRLMHVQVDGTYGPRTAAAVKRYQRTHGCVPDGIVGAATWAALLRSVGIAERNARERAIAAAKAAAAARAAERAKQARAALAPYRTTVLRKGDRGPAVAALQRRLSLAADGVFGPRTREAVVAFQRRQGLTADGVVGPRTWQALAG